MINHKDRGKTLSKNKKLRNIIILVCANVLALTMLITVLIVSSDGNKSNNDEIIVKDNVSVIVDTGEPDGGNIPIEVLDDKLVFNTDPKYPDGEVLVAGIIDTAPGGFIRKVISTAKEGEQYIVKTELGLLTDVFEQAHIKKSFVLTEDNAIEIDSNNAQTVANTKANKNDNSIYAYADEGSNAVTTSIFDVSKEYMFEKEFEKEIIKGLSVKANIEFGIQVEVELDIKKGDIIFSVIAYDVLDGGASAEFGAAAEFEEAIFEKHLPNIQFFIYVVPVVITNEFQLMV
jgi:hypothetical protein